MAENPQGQSGQTGQAGQYKCTACGKSFTSQNELREHERACKGQQQGGGQPTR